MRPWDLSSIDSAACPSSESASLFRETIPTPAQNTVVLDQTGQATQFMLLPLPGESAEMMFAPAGGPRLVTIDGQTLRTDGQTFEAVGPAEAARPRSPVAHRLVPGWTLRRLGEEREIREEGYRSHGDLLSSRDVRSSVVLDRAARAPRPSCRASVVRRAGIYVIRRGVVAPMRPVRVSCAP